MQFIKTLLALFWINLRFNIVPEDGGGGGDGDGNTAPLPLLNDDLSFTENYQERIGEHAAGSTFKDLPSLFKSVKEGTSAISKLTSEKAELAKQLETLKAGNTPQLPSDVAAYAQAIKLPDAATLPEGVTVPAELVKLASEFAFQKGISPEVTSAFIEFQIQQAGKEAKAYQTQQFAAIETAKQQIRSAVGAENYDTTIASAKAAADVLGLAFEAGDLLTHPSLVVNLAKLHSRVSPGTLKELGIGKEGQSAQGKLDQAQDILTNESNPHYAAFKDQSHPNHQAAMDTYNRLILESAG